MRSVLRHRYINVLIQYKQHSFFIRIILYVAYRVCYYSRAYFYLLYSIIILVHQIQVPWIYLNANNSYHIIVSCYALIILFLFTTGGSVIKIIYRTQADFDHSISTVRTNTLVCALV